MAADVPQAVNAAETSSEGATVAGSLTRPVAGGGLVMIWLLWLVLLAGGLIASNMSLNDKGFWSDFGRLGSSVTLVVAGWLFFLRYRATPAGRYLFWIATGMTFGALGDFFMAGLLQPIIPLPNAALGGIGAFGLGHVAYIAGCQNAHNRAGLNSPKVKWTAIIVWQLIGLISWYFVVYPAEAERLQILRWPALGYTLLLACTAGMGSSLAAQDRRFTILAIGGGLFLLSDLILAWRMFHGSFPHSAEAVWIPYGGGQMMIVYAITTALPALIAKRA